MRQLSDLARRSFAAARTSMRPPPERRSLRFNVQCHSVSVQLPPVAFAQTRACLEARARAVPSDGETPFDERLCDAFVELVATSTGPATSGTAKAAAPRPPSRAPTSSSPTSPSPPWSTPRARRAPSPASSSATG